MLWRRGHRPMEFQCYMRVIRITREQLARAAVARRHGFVDAILSIAKEEDGRLIIHNCDWAALTFAYTTGQTMTGARRCRPCGQSTP